MKKNENQKIDEVDDKIQALEEAEEKIYLAIELITQAVKGTSCQVSAEAYIIPHLQNWINDENQPANIQELKRAVEGRGDYI